MLILLFLPTKGLPPWSREVQAILLLPSQALSSLCVWVARGPRNTPAQPSGRLPSWRVSHGIRHGPLYPLPSLLITGAACAGPRWAEV